MSFACIFLAPIPFRNEVRRGGKRVIYFSLESTTKIKRLVLFNGRTFIDASPSIEWTHEKRDLLHEQAEC